MAKMASKACLALLMVSAATLSQAKCLNNINQFKSNGVKSQWKETTANDGKPLTISISNGPNGLVYSATKAGALWMTGNISICLSGSAKEITLKDIKSTNNVPTLARMALSSSQKAQIVGNQIRLQGGGWAGTFVGQ